MIIITVENVLAAGDDLKVAPPTRWAKSLYGGMRSQHHVLALTQASEELARTWLKREHLDDWSRVLCYPADRSIFSYDDWRVDCVREVLSEGWEVFFYVDTDPEVCARVGNFGVCTLTVSYPPIP